MEESKGEKEINLYYVGTCVNRTTNGKHATKHLLYFRMLLSNMAIKTY